MSRPARRLFLLPIAAACLLWAAAPSRAEVPPRPAEADTLWDEARLVDPGDAAEVRRIQEQVLREQGAPIVVVTIGRMSEYVPGSPSIETFTRIWFDEWGIGSRERNTGILLLVSRDDRRARIELGADWGREWDDHCRRIMDGTIVPAFKAGDYSKGIRRGVERLAEMAAAGPRGAPPGPSAGERLRSKSPGGPFPMWVGLILLAAGVVLILVAVFKPDLDPALRKRLLLIGGGLIIAAFLLYLVLILLAFFLRGKAGIGGGGGGGGGFGGGFSGGGGASGSW